MKNKKAFTLMEMLVVILLIGIILTIVIPSVIKIMNTNNNKMYDTHIELLKKQTELYTVKYNSKFINQKDVVCYKITYEDLILEGFEEEEIQCTGSVVINNSTNKNYTYEYYLKCADKDENIVSDNAHHAPTNCIDISANENRPSAPMITGGSTEWTNKNRTITVSKKGIAIDGVKNYEYFLSTTSQTPSTKVEATGTTSGKKTVDTEGITYVFYRTVANNGSKSRWSNSQTVKVDTQIPPVPTVSGEGNSIEIERTFEVTVDELLITPSGIKNFEYYISDKNEKLSADTKPTGAFTGSTITIKKTGTYIYFRTVNNAGGKSAWTEAKDLYINTAILSSLVVKDSNKEYELNPSYTREHLEYTLTVPNTTTKVEVSAKDVGGESKIIITSGEKTKEGITEVTSEVELKVGITEVTVEVIGTDTTRTYTIKIRREQDPISTLSSLKLSGCNLNPTFSSDVTGYKCTVENDVTSMKVEAETTSDTATITGLGTKSLKVGTNDIKVTVTSESGNKKVYTIAVTRKASSDATLKSLEVVDYQLNQEFNSNHTQYVVNVLYGVTSVIVKAEVNNIEASYVISGNTNLQVGPNDVNITVTAGDGTKKVYTVVILRANDTNNYLKSLSVADCTISPAFNKDITSYSCTVDYKIADTIVTAKASSNVAIVSGTGPVNLKVGTNEIIVTVVAQNSVKKEYKINITRKPDEDATLSSLQVLSYNLSPDFNSNTYEYSVETEASSIEIVAVANSAVASVMGTGVKKLGWSTYGYNIIVTAQSGKVISYKITVTNTQPKAPTITGGTSNWVATAPTIKVSKTGSALSGIKHYEYYQSTSSTAPTNATLSNGTVSTGTEATGTTSSDVKITNNGTIYIWYRTVSYNGHKSNWSTSSRQVVYLDTAKPGIKSVSGASTTWSNSSRNFTLTNNTASSGISSAYYYVSNSTTAPSASTAGTKCTSSTSCSAGHGKYIFFRIVNGAGTSSGWSTAYNNYVDTEPPIHTNWWWGEVTKDIVRLYIQATDNVGLSTVQCPTSTHAGGYTNWHWFQATWDSGANAYRCDITPAIFNHYGQTYMVYLYLYDHAGNGGYYNQATVNIPAKEVILTSTELPDGNRYTEKGLCWYINKYALSGNSFDYGNYTNCRFTSYTCNMLQGCDHMGWGGWYGWGEFDHNEGDPNIDGDEYWDIWDPVTDECEGTVVCEGTN